jgi:hypothetical protein
LNVLKEGTLPERLLSLSLAVLVVLAVASCGDVIVGGGPITTRADGVRVYAPVTSINGAPVACTPVDRGDQTVAGSVASDRSRAIDSVWLETAAGDVHVVWPDVFQFEFTDAGVTIRTQEGIVVATEGSRVALLDRPYDDAAGTEADPYVAWGRINDVGCWAYLEK